MMGFRSQNLGVLMLFLALNLDFWVVKGDPLRGSRRGASLSTMDQLFRRRLLEDRPGDVDTDDSVELRIDPTPSPTITSTENAAATEPSETEVPTDPLEETEAPVASNVRKLLSFSLRIEGALQNENSFRRDLELFLLTSMQKQVPSVENIVLEPAELSFGQRLRRSLQQATALGYEGQATLNEDEVQDENLPSTDQVREAQFNSLLTRSTGSLQSYLDEASSQSVSLLQIQIAGYQPVDLEGSGVDRNEASVNEENDYNLPLLFGVPVAVAVVLCCLGICIFWNNFIKPPPPPPYDPEDMDDAAGKADRALHLVGTPSTTASDRLQSPRSIASSESSQGEGDSNAAKTTAGLIDLSKPAKNANGVSSAPVEYQPPEDDSTFGGMSETFLSNDEESMAGYSLEGPELDKTVDPKRSLIESIIKERAAARTSQTSGEVHTSAHTRWMLPQINKSKKLRPWSSKGGNVASSSREIDNVYVEDDEIEVVSHSSGMSGTSNSRISRGSTPSAVNSGGASRSSATSVAGNSAVSRVSATSGANSATSRASPVSVAHSTTSQASAASVAQSRVSRASGMSGTSRRSFLSDRSTREVQESVVPAVLPQLRAPVPVRSYSPLIFDDVSDVPSDEKSMNRSTEQDLGGFLNAGSIKKALDEFTGTRSQEPPPTLVPPPDGSWEENPEMMEAWIRERRRIKQQARSRLQDRS